MKDTRKTLFSVYFVIFLDNFGFSLLFALLGPLILLPSYGLVGPEASTHVKEILLALVYAVFPLTQFFGSPILGDLADQFGRKKVFYLTIGGGVVGYLLSGVAIALHSISFLLFARLLTGFFAGNLSIALASLADLSPTVALRAKNYGKVSALLGISWVLAMIVGGYLADPEVLGVHGPALVFLFTGLLSIVNFLAIAKWFHETHERKGAFRLDLLGGVRHALAALKLREVRLYYAVYFFWILGWGMTIQWFSPYSIQHYHPTILVITAAMVLFGIAWTIGGSWVNTLLLKRFSSLQLVLGGLLLSALLILLCGMGESYLLFSLVYSAGSLVSAFTMSNAMNLISTSASAAIQGKIMGISQSVMACGWIVNGLLALLLPNMESLFFRCALFLFIAFLFCLAQGIRKKKSAGGAS